MDGQSDYLLKTAKFPPFSRWKVKNGHHYWNTQGQITFHNAQHIKQLFLRQWSRAYLIRVTIKSYGPGHWLDFYDTHVIICAWYNSSCWVQPTWKTAKLTSLQVAKYNLKYTPDCTRLHTPSLVDFHSQAPHKCTLNMCPSTPLCIISNTLLGMISVTLSTAFDGTHPTCLTVCSQAHSQNTPMSTSISLSCTLPIALHGTPPAYLGLYSHVHS